MPPAPHWSVAQWDIAEAPGAASENVTEIFLGPHTRNARAAIFKRVG